MLFSTRGTGKFALQNCHLIFQRSFFFSQPGKRNPTSLLVSNCGLLSDGINRDKTKLNSSFEITSTLHIPHLNNICAAFLYNNIQISCSVRNPGSGLADWRVLIAYNARFFCVNDFSPYQQLHKNNCFD